jgi:hypothetical protein
VYKKTWLHLFAVALVITVILINPVVVSAGDPPGTVKTTDSIVSGWSDWRQQLKNGNDLLNSANNGFKTWIGGMALGGLFKMTVPELKWVKFGYDVSQGFPIKNNTPVESFKSLNIITALGSLANPNVGILGPILKGYWGFTMKMDAYSSKLLDDLKTSSNVGNALKSPSLGVNNDLTKQQFNKMNNQLNLMQERRWPYSSSGTSSPSLPKPQISQFSISPKVTVPSYQFKSNSSALSRR